jgi:NADPH-dependent ferric siderophore reductase
VTGTDNRHQVTRIRRETRRRTLTVAATEKLSAHLLRIRFTSPDLTDFESAAPDDHVKLFLPNDDFENGRPAMRDYTPRAFDTVAGTLTIDFAVHEAGPATTWAMAARPGDTIQIGGPRGSAVVADDFDWYLLIGDETALPAICRRLEELRAGVPVIALLAVDSAEDEIAMPERTALDVSWTRRSESGDDTARLIALIDEHPRPTGDGYVWIAGESSVARAVRGYVIETLGHPREWTKAAGYWTRGVADAHERIDD